MAHWRHRSLFNNTDLPTNTNTSEDALPPLSIQTVQTDEKPTPPYPQTGTDADPCTVPPKDEKPFTNTTVDLTLWPPFIRVDQLALLTHDEVLHVLKLTEAFLHNQSNQPPEQNTDEWKTYAEKQLLAARAAIREHPQVERAIEDTGMTEGRKAEVSSVVDATEEGDPRPPSMSVSKAKGVALMVRQGSQGDFVIYAGVKESREKTKALEREKMKKRADRLVARRERQRKKDRLRKQEEAGKRVVDREKRRKIWEQERLERVERAEKYRRDREQALQRKRAQRKEAARLVETKQEVKSSVDKGKPNVSDGESDEGEDEDEQTAEELDRLAEALEEERAANEDDDVPDVIREAEESIASHVEENGRFPLNLSVPTEAVNSPDGEVDTDWQDRKLGSSQEVLPQEDIVLSSRSASQGKENDPVENEELNSSSDSEATDSVESDNYATALKEGLLIDERTRKQDNRLIVEAETKVDKEGKSPEAECAPCEKPLDASEHKNDLDSDLRLSPATEETSSEQKSGQNSAASEIHMEPVEAKGGRLRSPSVEQHASPKEATIQDEGSKEASGVEDVERKEDIAAKSYCDAIIQDEFGGQLVDYSSVFRSFSDVFAVVQNGKKLSLEEMSHLMDKTARTYGAFNRIACAIQDGATGATMTNPMACFYRVHFRSRSEVYNIVKEACSRLGYEELPKNMNLQTSWNLLWTWTKPRVNREDLLSWNLVNHFEESKYLTRKDLFNKCLERVRCLSGAHADYFDIQPTTFVLPKEYLKFVRAYADNDEGEDNIWIMKPVGLSRGRGISLIADIGDVSYGQSVIIQRYITNPLTLDGFKYDLRLYVLVTSFQPLEAYVYEEGFVRVCTVPYSTHPEALKDLRVHLTNSSIQQVDGAGAKASRVTRERHGAFIHEAGGTKLSLSYLWRRLKASGVDVPALKASIEETLVKSLMCARDNFTKACNSFELYGYDVLIDANLKPWLVEINSSPSLGLDNELDHKIKRQLIYDTVRLVNPLPYDKKALEEVLSRRVVSLENRRLRPYLAAPVSAEDQLNRDLTAILHGAMPRRPGEPPSEIGAYRKIAPDTPICHKTERLLRKSRAGKTQSTSSFTSSKSCEPPEQKLARLALKAGVKL